jgi:hypothetical protein
MQRYNTCFVIRFSHDRTPTTQLTPPVLHNDTWERWGMIVKSYVMLDFPSQVAFTGQMFRIGFLRINRFLT